MKFRVAKRGLFLILFTQLLLVLFLTSVAFIVYFLKREKTSENLRYSRYNPAILKYKHLRYHPSRSTYSVRYETIFEGEDSLYFRDDYVLVSKSDSSEFKCTGTCFCDDRKKIASMPIVKKGITSLISAITSVVALNLSEKHFRKKCQQEMSDESSKCSLDSIRSKVDSCDRVYEWINSGWNFDEVENHHSSISNFKSKEYVCEGRCFCEGEKEEDTRRQVTATTFIVSRVVVYLVASVSSVFAMQIAKQKFEDFCLKDLIKTCAPAKIKSTLDDCWEADPDHLVPVEEANNRIGDSLNKKAYLCTGTCMNYEFMPYIGDRTDIEFMIAEEKVKSFECDKMTLSKEYILFEYGEDILKMEEVGSPKELAELSFKRRELTDYCMDNSRVDLTSLDVTESFSCCVAHLGNLYNKNVECKEI